MAPIADTEQAILHATALALGDCAALLRGPSGSGKSDLALRAVATPLAPFTQENFQLVGDDQVVVRRTGQDLLVSPHPRLQGLIEVRGVGILTLPHAATARVDLIVDLVAPPEVSRLPDPWPRQSLLGVSLPILHLAPFESSAALKIALALIERPWLPR